MSQAVAQRPEESVASSPRPVAPAVDTTSRPLGLPRRSYPFLRPSVIVGAGLKGAAHLAWHAFQAVNRRIPYGQMHPKWAPAPLLKSKDRTFPQLGFPRETDSLCPQCVKEVREKIVGGDADWRMHLQGKPGEVKARIVERDG